MRVRLLERTHWVLGRIIAALLCEHVALARGVSLPLRGRTLKRNCLRAEQYFLRVEHEVSQLPQQGL